MLIGLRIGITAPIETDRNPGQRGLRKEAPLLLWWEGEEPGFVGFGGFQRISAEDFGEDFGTPIVEDFGTPIGLVLEGLVLGQGLVLSFGELVLP